MSDNPDSNRAAEGGRIVPEREPYPRMILVCMGIALVLVLIIFSFIFFDFMNRSESGMRPVRPPATQTPVTPANP